MFGVLISGRWPCVVPQCAQGFQADEQEWAALRCHHLLRPVFHPRLHGRFRGLWKGFPMYVDSGLWDEVFMHSQGFPT
jgi:hypothetical protein